MGDHSRADRFPPPGEDAGEQSSESDDEHGPDALIRMARAEQNGGYHNAGGNAIGEAGELLLQVSAVDRLFADPGAQRDENPEPLLIYTLRHKELHRRIGSSRMAVRPEQR